MSISVSAKLCFGVLLDEEEQQPWDEYWSHEFNEHTGGDIEEWWREVNGFKSSYPVDWENYDRAWRKSPEGTEYFNKRYEERREWEKQNPLPVDLVNVCSDSYPMWILAINESIISASFGDPETFLPYELDDKIVGKCIVFVDFLRKYDIKYSSSPQWYLGAEYGV